jgi:hypothetical protein
MSKATQLNLKIVYQGRSADFTLVADRPFLIGRAPDVDLQVDADSISQKHLELLWDGALLRVRDLESSNGSFRMPQDSPFLEAHFGPRDRELHLKIAKTLITLSWSDPTDSSEKTEVLETGSSAGHASAKVSSVLRAPSVAPKSQSSLEASLPKAEARSLSAWAKPLLLAGVLAASIQNFYFFTQHASLISTQTSVWLLGPAIDLYIFWLADLPVFAGVWAFALIVAYVLHKKLLPMPQGKRALIFKTLGFAMMSLVFAWPLVFLKASGNALQTRAAVGEFRELREVVATHDFRAKEKNLQISSKLTDLSTPLKGSSIFYAFWHNFQKKRVVDECGGVGEGSWDKKRVCLVLLFALSLDGYTSIRPLYLGPTASELIYLSSLDGVIRVLAAEGPGSENIKLFISTLDDVGLKKEAGDFVALVQSFRGQRFEDLMQALLELRLNIEKKIFESQERAGLPAPMKLNLMGPLEMGI